MCLLAVFCYFTVVRIFPRFLMFFVLCVCAISWYTLDDPAVEDRDLEFAMAAAKAANEASGGNDAAVLDTLARAYFETGDLNRAIKFQKKAVENAGDDRMSNDIRKTLKKYEDAAQAKTT